MESVWVTLIKDGFVVVNLRPSTLITTIMNEKKDHINVLAKSAKIIKELVDKSLYPLLNNKTSTEI